MDDFTDPTEEQLRRIEAIGLADLFDGPLATLAAAAEVELARRLSTRQRDLTAARQIWPQLTQALKATGRQLLWHMIPQGETELPFMPPWSTEAGCYLDRKYFKPKTKAEAWKIALTYGDGGFASVSELWLWVGGGGPIVDRALHRFGFFGKRPAPTPAWRITS